MSYRTLVKAIQRVEILKLEARREIIKSIKDVLQPPPPNKSNEVTE